MDKNLNYEKSENCPVCGRATLEPGERVDVGFGISMGVKAGPDRCWTCGYVEAGPDPSDPPIDYYIKCWKEKIVPGSELPAMIKRPMEGRYQAWIESNVEGDGYGMCREVCAKMVKAFPELKRVYGTYYCVIWGERHHFWCITQDGAIVDPTVGQFPSKGIGKYSMSRFYGLEYDPQKANKSE